MKTHKNHSLKNLNAFHVDTKTKYLVIINTEDDLEALLSDKKYKKMKKCVLGESSGTLFTKNFDGLVIKIDIIGIKINREDKSSIEIEVGAGEIWDDLVVWAINRKLQGIENMSGIPGTVGAAPVQNIAAYGQEFADLFVSLRAVGIGSGELVEFNKKDLEFKYRDSVFKNKFKDKYIITKVILQLDKPRKLDLTYHSRYESIKSELKKVAKKPYSLSDIRKAVLSIRSRKFPDWKVHGNSGSFFKNPFISKEKLAEIQKKYPKVQYYPVEKMQYPQTDDKKLKKADQVKLAAAWLFDELGWKGKRIGNVGTSPNQALVIVNYGGATAEEILSFAKKMSKDFEKNFGIRLKPEVRII